MTKITVVQTDNRPNLNYLLKTQEVNKKFCTLLGYNYLFLNLDIANCKNMHPATQKIKLVYDFLQTTDSDILIFLDSDAWIHNGHYLNCIMTNLIKDKSKQGCFSRDPYVYKNSYINSGSFIIRINDFTKKMYESIHSTLYKSPTHHWNWPFDQFYISNYVFEHRKHFVIFVPDILNTPLGKVFKHNWLKNQLMWDDLSKVNYCPLRSSFNEKDFYDKEDFPNVIENGYEYFS